MLSNASIVPVVHVADLDRARRFYGGVLGLRDKGKQESGNFLFAANGTTLELMLKPDGVQRDNTVLSFEVSDVDSEMKELETKGVRFEDVEVPGAKKNGKVSVMGKDRAAWLKDSEGNWLCLHDHKGVKPQ